MAITGDEKTTKSLSDIMQAQTVHLESLDAHPHPGKISEADEVSIAEEATGEHLPDGYYLSFNFIGTFVALCLSSCALYMYLLMPTAVLSVINNDIGPSPMIAWWAIGRTAAQSITFTLVGRLSDIFGRRWFFIGGNAVALIGTAVTASSHNIAQLSIGSAITGVGEAVQNSYIIALPELVKNKHRPIVVSLVFASSAPFATFGSIIATTMIDRGISWRWMFYLPLICIFVAVVLLIICYHPPSYSQLHASGRMTKVQQLKQLDYVGIFLYISSIVLILLPLSWGGSLFPWNSAATIATLVVGLVLLVATGLWEAYSKQPSPLIPMHFFKNRGFISLVVCATIGSCSYFPCIYLWPQQVAQIYSISGSHAGWLACTVGGSTALGTSIAGLFIRAFGNSRIILVVSSVAMTAFIAALAGLTPSNLNLGIALTILGPFFVGIIELAALSLAPLFCKPEDLGVAAGLLGTIRSAGASIAVAIFSSILSTRLASTIPAAVLPVAKQAGLSPEGAAALVGAASSGDLSKVPGITTGIIEAVAEVLPGAFAKAFKTVYLSSLAFGGLAIIASLLTKDATPYLTDEVARKLQGNNPSSRSKLETES